jgi:hypothetical protein
MNRWMLVVAACALVGCGDPKKEGLGKATADVASDTKTLGAAEAAANDVLRNPTDCDAVKAALPEANRAIAQAEKEVRTAAGQTTLQAIKTQVRSVAQNCP